MFSLKRVLSFAVLLVAGLATNASATTFAEISLEELVAASPVIARGNVGKVESFWNADRTAIYTHVTLQVEDTLRGKVASEQIVVRLPGGTVNGVSQIVIGAPQLEAENEVVLMLEEAPSNQSARAPAASGYILIGLSQGVFDVAYDDKGAATVKSRMIGLMADTEAREAVAPPAGYDGMPIEAFMKVVQEIPGKKRAPLAPAEEAENTEEIGSGKGEKEEGRAGKVEEEESEERDDREEGT